MNFYAGSYINVGLINSLTEKINFINNIKMLLKHYQSKIGNCIFSFPIDDECNEWKKEAILNFDDDRVFQILSERTMSQLSCNFYYQGEVIDDILLQVETYKNDSIGLLISIRQESICKNRTLDNAEQMIISFMQNALNFNFVYAYCDTEAFIEATIADVIEAKKDFYSILFIRNSPNVERYSNWKIDGFTLRENKKA